MSWNVALEAKDIRHAYNTLEKIEASQYQLATLLHRLYYKSKSQHRSAKWFQSIDGVRKCYNRLLKMSCVVSVVKESLPDKGVGKKAKLNRLQRDDDRAASIDDAKLAIAQVWDSLWGQSDLKGADGLTKHDTLPQQEANPELCKNVALKLLIVCLQLEELANRSRHSFKLMELHLRTPPAPTFAPLIMTLLTLCAGISTTCQNVLWDNKIGDATLTSMYLQFCRLQDSTKSSMSPAYFIMDAHSRTNSASWSKMLVKVNQKKQRHLDWLPQKLVQAKHISSVPEVNVSPDLSVQYALAEDTQIFEGDEDLGEAL